MSKIEESIQLIKILGLPAAQHNDRTALCLLALLNLSEDKPWSQSVAPLLGNRRIIDFAAEKYDVVYAANTRESVRKYSLHQLVDAGIILLNPDKPARVTNSPKTSYQVEPSLLALFKTFGTDQWDETLKEFSSGYKSLAEKYAKERDIHKIPIKIAEGKEILISPGPHSELIKAIIEQFAGRYAPGSRLVYVGDTGEKMGYIDDDILNELEINIEQHGKMPDVILYYEEKNWLLLVESVTSSGPVDGKRHAELSKLFASSTAPLVYVTAFPSRVEAKKYFPIISWETEVWCADAPTHLIHFNGIRFLGPYSTNNE